MYGDTLNARTKFWKVPLERSSASHVCEVQAGPEAANPLFGLLRSKHKQYEVLALSVHLDCTPLWSFSALYGEK